MHTSTRGEHWRLVPGTDDGRPWLRCLEADRWSSEYRQGGGRPFIVERMTLRLMTDVVDHSPCGFVNGQLDGAQKR